MVNGNAEYGYFLKPLVIYGRWFLDGEPERSRRVARLAFANWLTHCDEPWATRPSTYTDHHFFEPDPSPRGPAYAPSPEALERLIDSTLLVRYSLDPFNMYQREVARGSAERAELVLDLAERLYFREHGTFVPPAVLVGRTLKALPDGYEPDLWWSRPGPRAFRPAGYPGDPWVERMIPIAPPD
jgi:hypothetical protein